MMTNEDINSRYDGTIKSPFTGYHETVVNKLHMPYTITTNNSCIEENNFYKVLELAQILDSNPSSVAERFSKILAIVYGNY